MKPYFVTHKGFGLGLYVGKLPTGQWDFCLSLTFISVGLRQKMTVDPERVETEVERLAKEYGIDEHL